MPLRRPALFLLALFIFISASAPARDITFFVAADLHYGQDQSKNNEQGNKKVIDLMNNLPGTAFPEAVFGKVAEPRGVILVGDLTDSGTQVNYDGHSLGVHLFDGFVDDYPVKNGSGVHIHFPVYEGYGNHDAEKQTGDAVLNGIAARNRNRSTAVNVSPNGLHYSWDWDDVHFVNVNVYPGMEGIARDSLAFLRQDLADRAPGRKPIVILHHYGFDPVSTEDRCHRIIWNGIPDFIAPKARGDKGTDGFYVVRMLDDKMIVAQRHLGSQWDKVWTMELPAPAP
jgi:hypothetical protein